MLYFKILGRLVGIARVAHLETSFCRISNEQMLLALLKTEVMRISDEQMLLAHLKTEIMRISDELNKNMQVRTFLYKCEKLAHRRLFEKFLMIFS